MVFHSVYFDTNIFQDVAEGGIQHSSWQQMLQLTTQLNIKRCYTPITFVEIASRITYRNRGRFQHIQKILKVIDDCCGSNMFRDPNSLLARFFKHERPNDAEGFYRALLMIIGANDYRSLVNGQEWPELNFRGRLRVRFVKQYRNIAEEKWIRSLYVYVISLVNPNYVRGNVDTYKPPSSQINKFLEFYGSNEFKEAILVHLMNRCGVKLIGPITAQDLKMLLPIDAAFHFYKYLLIKMIQTGYLPEKDKHRNDFNDFHFLFYLGLGEDYCFVTNDGQFHKALQNSTQKNQVKTFDEFMEHLKLMSPKEP